MIGNIPLKILLLIWWLQRKYVIGIKPLNIEKRLRMLNEIYYSLPVVQLNDWLGGRCVEKVITWIDCEKQSLIELQSLGVQASGVIKQ
ncbi:hypothetical protein ADN00_18800 [Ornatilinea apprima]|uniref:Uncharacterized protein n=1 Tax=Ornatilinea apprima TaxID=1134406 RepID=A0A0P6WMR5_9CHLR|nr:hypothetical protein [Ornatilinea apprima]KPL70094.1 hypothetical protein ADN00_18800 [Ornatilinea apprima]